MAKIKIIKDNCKRFGGLQVLIQSDIWKWLMKLIDKELGKRTKDNSGYSFSEVLGAIFCSVIAGGTAIEDVKN